MSTTTRFEQPAGYTLTEVPRFVQYTSPVLPGPNHTSGSSQLPLNLIALIVSYLDDIADIARVTRTSRLLYYMTLPQLYQRVALHSYPEMRYKNGRPEGYGSGSPFMMALNGLVTKGHAGLVRDLRLWGQWREVGSEDFGKGRVPDNSMMLNILLRACVDKMAKLHSFSWELDCKPLKTLYQGLAARPTLTSLTIRFPSSRLPRPSVIVPVMPALRVFKALEIDPLCYPDDISVLIASSPNLRDLRLHFSPRMRLAAEPTLNMESYFGRCDLMPPSITHLALQNWFGATTQGFKRIFNWHPTICEGITMLDTFGGAHGGSANVFIDDSWRFAAREVTQRFKKLRFNDFAPHHVDMLRNSSGLERVYVVNDRLTTNNTQTPQTSTETPKSDTTASLATPSDTPTPNSTTSPEIATLGHAYVIALTRNHGSTLRHLLLSNQWPLTEPEVSDLVRFCPNLSQLGLAIGFPNTSTLRLLLPFLPKLRACRILDNDVLRSSEEGHMDPEARRELMSRDLARFGAEIVMWIGVGEWIYRIGGFEEVAGERRRRVRLVGKEEVQGVEIWRLDCLDVMGEVVEVG